MSKQSSCYYKDDNYKTRAKLDEVGGRENLPRKAKVPQNLNETEASSENIRSPAKLSDVKNDDSTPEASEMSCESEDKSWEKVSQKQRDKAPMLSELKLRRPKKIDEHVVSTSNSFDALSSISDEECEPEEFHDAENDNEYKNEKINISVSLLSTAGKRNKTRNLMSKLVKFNCPVLDGKNYDTWSILMESSLDQNNLWFDPKTSLANVEATEALQKKNKSCAQFMLGYLDPSIIKLLEFPRCFVRSWQRLEELYKHENQEDIAMLYGKLMTLKPSSSEPISVHINAFESIYSKFPQINACIKKINEWLMVC